MSELLYECICAQCWHSEEKAPVMYEMVPTEQVPKSQNNSRHHKRWCNVDALYLPTAP